MTRIEGEKKDLPDNQADQFSPEAHRCTEFPVKTKTSHLPTVKPH